jgi:hypothetical protein
MAIYRVRRYIRQVKGKIFSVAEHTAQTQMKMGSKLSNLEKRKLAKKGLERSRIIQRARVRAIGMRAK